MASTSGLYMQLVLRNKDFYCCHENRRLYEENINFLKKVDFLIEFINKQERTALYDAIFKVENLRIGEKCDELCKFVTPKSIRIAKHKLNERMSEMFSSNFNDDNI